LPFPDGAIIARLAWSYVPSEENNKVFGCAQSFVAGSATNVQFMVKDSRKYAATGGWGFAQFKDGKPADAALLKTCFLPRACQSSRLRLHSLRALNTGRSHEEGKIVLQFDLRRPDQNGGARVITVHSCGDGIVRSGAG
jgi:hypothetical protein